jgi:hypothetical protein
VGQWGYIVLPDDIGQAGYPANGEGGDIQFLPGQQILADDDGDLRVKVHCFSPKK